MSEQLINALSVRDIVRRRTGADPDTWRLALVQRAKVWDHVRMRYLLDSLLRGYPIGSLLLCRVTGKAHVMSFDDRDAVEAAEGTWQLLDGQQRINALYSIFTDLANYGRFYMLMTQSLPETEGPMTGRRRRDEGLKYLHWQDVKEVESAVPGREHRVDLGGWYAWAEREGEARLNEAAKSLDSSRDAVSGLLNELDPDFTDDLDDSQMRTATDLLCRLIGVWLSPTLLV